MKQLSKEEVIHNILSRQHVTSRHCDEIDAICKPLSDIIPVNYFNYARYYWQPGVPSFSFCNRFDTIEHFFRVEGYRYVADFFPTIFPGLHFLDNYTKKINPSTDPKSIHIYIKKVEKDLNIAHLVNMTFVCVGYSELFTFGFPAETENTYSLVLNNKPFIKKFTIYFRDKARHLIKEAKKNKIPITLFNSDFTNSLSFENLKSMQSSGQKDLNDLLKPKRYYLDGRFDDVYLTSREAQCVLLLQYKNGYQQIADELKLSYATVREHIDTIKRKLNCSNKTELLNAIRSTNFLNFIDDTATLSSMHNPFYEKPTGYQTIDETMDIFEKENSG